MFTLSSWNFKYDDDDDKIERQRCEEFSKIISLDFVIKFVLSCTVLFFFKRNKYDVCVYFKVFDISHTNG